MKTTLLISSAILIGIWVNPLTPDLFVSMPVKTITEASTPIPQPLSKQEIIAKSKHPEMIDHFWLKETTRGKDKNPLALHNLCKAQGKSNEFGYGGMAMKLCYDSFQEAVNVVDAWLTERDKEVACYYNLGTRTSKCNYAQDLTLVTP